MLHLEREQFHDVVISVRDNLKEIAKSLSSEVRERFPRDELLEAMSIVYPQYWDHSQNQKNLEADFIRKIKILQSHFCREAEIQGEHIQGILDKEKWHINLNALVKQCGTNFIHRIVKNMVQLQDY